MATTAYVPWFDAVKSLDLNSMSDVFSATPSVTMFLTTESLKDLDDVFGKEDICRMNALQWCLWHYSEDSTKRQAVIRWLIQKSTPSELNDHRWGNGNTSLHIAAYRNEPAIVKAMLDQGALPHLTNGLNLTASDISTQEDIRNILGDATTGILSRPNPLDITLSGGKNISTLSDCHQSPITLVADAITSHQGNESTLAAQTPMLRSILRSTPSYHSDLNGSLTRDDSLKKKVTFNESAEIRQYMELSSDEEVMPKRRRRGFFMMMNYDEESEEEEEETEEETEQDIAGDDIEVKIQDPSDELDILARLQQEMHAFEEYENPSSYDWDQFVDDENDDDQEELNQDFVVTMLSPSTKQMDLEEEVPEMVNDTEDLLLMQTLETVRSESADSLLKELIATPTSRSDIEVYPVEGQVQPVEVDQPQLEDTTKENISHPKATPEYENMQEVPFLPTEADQQEAKDKECQPHIKSVEVDMIQQQQQQQVEATQQVICEEDIVMTVVETSVVDEASPTNDACVPQVALVEPSMDEDKTASLRTSNVDIDVDCTSQDALDDNNEAIAESTVEEQINFWEQKAANIDTEPTKVASSDSLPSERSYISSASESEDTNRRYQAVGSQRVRWESDIMSPVDNDPPMSFAAIFAAHQNKQQPEMRMDPPSYIDLLLADDDAHEDSLTEEGSTSTQVTDISVKPLPAVPSGEPSASKLISGIFQKLSDKRRIAPAMNGLKQISMPNLKRISLEHALRRRSFTSTQEDKLENVKIVKPQSEAEKVAQAQGDNVNKLSKSVQSATKLSKYFVMNRKVSVDSENSDSSNVLEIESQSSVSGCDTPPSSPSPTGSFEDKEKRLSVVTKRSSVRSRQSMPSFTSTNTPLKSATSHKETCSDNLKQSPESQRSLTDISKRHSFGFDSELSAQKFVLDVAERNHAVAFANNMQESLERISDGQKPKTYTEKYQQDIIHLSSPKDFSPKREGSVSPSWKAAQDQQKGGTFTKSKQRSAAHATKSPKDIPGKLYVRVVAVQDINVPIPSEPTYVRCILNDGTYEHLSKYVILGRHMQFDQEFKITANSRLDFSLSLHVRPDSHVKPKAPITRLLNSHKKVAPELSQFVNRPDGAIGSTKINFGDMMDECRNKLCSATFPSQNDWAIDVSRTIDKLESTKVKPKTVGKLVLHLVYLPGTKDRNIKYPRDIDECMRGFDNRRWHENVWRTGYMSQMGGDVNFWRRRYYKAVGARLLAYHDTHLAPRAAIDLTQAVRLTSNGRLIFGTPQSPEQSSNHSETSEEDCVKNSFQFTFSNGEKIDFFCDTERERDVWINTLRAALRSIPQWPEWLFDGKDDIIM
ncbi:hypothetical protein BGW37DRAFT_492790 [Umbelopsis sp. PMI_123]|nr:hypothetical protein BGW37DRAFT_492790 [Umbelopsis sp. PMI_123]